MSKVFLLSVDGVSQNSHRQLEFRIFFISESKAMELGHVRMWRTRGNGMCPILGDWGQSDMNSDPGQKRFPCQRHDWCLETKNKTLATSIYPTPQGPPGMWVCGG